jgi:hypothetical protein
MFTTFGSLILLLHSKVRSLSVDVSWQRGQEPFSRAGAYSCFKRVSILRIFPLAEKDGVDQGAFALLRQADSVISDRKQTQK